MVDSSRLSVSSGRITRRRPAPERGTNRELTGEHGRASKQQVGHVGAADEEHEADDAEKEPGCQAQVGSHQRLTQRLDGDPAAHVGGRKFLREPGRDGCHVRVGRVEGDAGFEPADRQQDARWA